MLIRLFHRWQREGWPARLAGLCAATAAVAGVVLAVDRLAEQHLAADAQRSARAWGQHVGSTVPDIDLVFLGERPSPAAQDRLLAMRGMAGLFGFRLYDPQGRLLLASDSVATAPRAGDADAQRQVLARAVAAGEPATAALLQGDGLHTPRLYSRAQAAVRHGAVTIGVIEVDVDQTEPAATTAASFRHAALLAGLAMALTLCGAATLMRHRSRAERSARHRAAFLAEHDALTGTLNHGHFSQALERACQAGPGPSPGVMAVICLDLDGFGEVNDRHGHQAGDDLLRRCAARLQRSVGSHDLVARLAGDRFAVLQHGAADHAAVLACVQRLLDQLAQPHELPGRPGALCHGAQPATTLRISASAGVALHGPDGGDADTLLNNAELALQRAKAGGRGGWSFYDATLDRRLQERRALASDLSGALAQRSLRLHYQPLWSAGDQTLRGYEALARWPHPLRGFVPPAEFIATAEATGQIEALGRWVLQAACTEAATWPAPLSVAVNLSAAQFRRGQAIVAEVAQALRDSGLAPQRLELEITESLLMQHTEQVLATLHALRALGVRIAMDDFGTGYSSLAYLWRFPFDKLKIDRAFTQGLGNDPRVDVIVRSIVRLAHSLAIRVNAEGVETEAQRDALRRLGCDELQGYLLGRPVPAERLPHLEQEIVAVVTENVAKTALPA